jgi:hypothetical protein
MDSMGKNLSTNPLEDFKIRFIATIGSGTGNGSLGISLADAKRLMVYAPLLMDIFSHIL